METPAPFRGQRIVGGNVALDLLNTQNGSAGEAPEDDVLGDYADFLAWAGHVGIVSEAEAEQLSRRARRSPADAATAFERARATRGYLYTLFSAAARGREPSQHDLARLQGDEAEALAHARLERSDGGYSWRWAGDRSLARPLWPVIHAATELVTNGPVDRIKGCASCRFHFLDESKNRSRRWCSMDDCGAQDKMRKYVARRAQRRLSTNS